MSQKKNVFVLIPISCGAGTITASVYVVLFYVLVVNTRHLSLREMGILFPLFQKWHFEIIS